MGLFKFIGMVSGLPIRPTTGRERARKYQRQANNLLEEQLDAIQNLAQPQQVIQAPSDSRPRGTCPACMEMMLVGASVCPHCRTTGVTWPGDTPKPVDIPRPSTTFEAERFKHNHNQEKGNGSFPCPVCGAERTRIKGNSVNPCGSCGTRKY